MTADQALDIAVEVYGIMAENNVEKVAKVYGRGFRDGMKIAVEKMMDSAVNREVVPPDDMTNVEMQGWLNRYGKCQHDIIDLLMSLQEGMNDDNKT